MAVSESSARIRIRDAALERFGRDGVNRVTIRAIAAEAGVSPALVVHHFGTMEALRRECDGYVVASIRSGGADEPDELADAAGDARGLFRELEATAPVRRYLARAFLDGSPEAAALFDEIVELTAVWLDEGRQEGRVRASADPRMRAVVCVTHLLAPLVFDEHVARVMGSEDLHDVTATLRYSRAAVEMFTHGVFTGEYALDEWDTVSKEREARESSFHSRHDLVKGTDDHHDGF